MFYKGQPALKIAVHAIVSSGRSKEATSDAQVAVRFDMPWKSVYVLEASHLDKTGSERAGKAYATATYVIADGNTDQRRRTDSGRSGAGAERGALTV